jgi:Phytanoyl-CoA dioxygenase (PhyH)
VTRADGATDSPRVQLTTNGVAIVRGFLSGDQTTALRGVVASVYDAMASCAEFSNPGMAENFKLWNGVWLQPLPDFLNGRATLSAQYRASVATVARRTRMLFGGGWRYYPLRSYFRKYTGAEELVPWHIDADAARVDRPEAINVWLPLDAVGVELPSLEMVVGSHDKMRRLPLLTGERRYRDDAFAASAGTKIVPQLDPGDAIIFDHFTLHRTQPQLGEIFERTSCEFRFIKLSGWRGLLAMTSSQWPPSFLAKDQ